MEMSYVTASLATVAVEGSHDEVTEHVQTVKEGTLKMGHMTDTLARFVQDYDSLLWIFYI